MREYGFAEDGQGDSVRVERDALDSLSAGTADLRQSAVRRLTAETAHLDRSAVATAKATTVELRESAAGIVSGDYVRVEDSAVMVLLAPRVSGNVRTLITVPVALAIGVGFAVVRTVLPLLFRRRKRK